MFTIIKSFFGGRGSKVLLMLIAAGTLMAAYFKGASAKEDEMELESRDALDESEAEGHRVLTERLKEEGEAVENAHNRTTRRNFD